MPRSDRTVPRRRRFGALAEGFALMAFTAAIAVPAALVGVTSFDGRPVNGPTPERVITCDSGVVHQGDVSTSSAVATRIPAGAPATVPPGCKEG